MEQKSLPKQPSTLEVNRKERQNYMATDRFQKSFPTKKHAQYRNGKQTIDRPSKPLKRTNQKQVIKRPIHAVRGKR